LAPAGLARSVKPAVFPQESEARQEGIEPSTC
jgi:hypothetical protein